MKAIKNLLGNKTFYIFSGAIATDYPTTRSQSMAEIYLDDAIRNGVKDARIFAVIDDK